MARKYVSPHPGPLIWDDGDLNSFWREINRQRDWPPALKKKPAIQLHASPPDEKNPAEEK